MSKQPESVERFVHDLDDGFLDCRLLRHAWSGTRRLYRVRNALFTGAVARRLVCDRCGTERLDYLNSGDFKPFHRRYAYSSGYLRKGPERGVDRALVEQEIQRRSTVVGAPELIEEIAYKRNVFEHRRMDAEPPKMKKVAS